jgi:hypothetical protein
MTGNTKYLSILTLKDNDLNAPIKRHRPANCIKYKIQPHMAYKRLISLKKINTGLVSKRGRRFSKQMDT